MFSWPFQVHHKCSSGVMNPRICFFGISFGVGVRFVATAVSEGCPAAAVFFPRFPTLQNAKKNGCPWRPQDPLGSHRRPGTTPRPLYLHPSGSPVASKWVLKSPQAALSFWVFCKVGKHVKKTLPQAPSGDQKKASKPSFHCPGPSETLGKIR